MTAERMLNTWWTKKDNTEWTTSVLAKKDNTDLTTSEGKRNGQLSLSSLPIRGCQIRVVPF